MQYITAETIRTLREQKALTQKQLAQRLNVSDKTISKWETAKGLPDITLLESLAQALDVSVMELMSGQPIINKNTSLAILPEIVLFSIKPTKAPKLSADTGLFVMDKHSLFK